MRGYVANTDFDWYRSLLSRPDLDEVNFWQPSGSREFRTIPPGAPFFFKLKSPHYAVGGFGYFAHGSRVPLSYAWEAFGEKNGAESLSEMRDRIQRYVKGPLRRQDDPVIGCLMISEPVFFPEMEWVTQPADWPKNAVQGKTYDLQAGEGLRVWAECRERVQGRGRERLAIGADRRFGDPVLVMPRLGQGTFRVAVLDAYGRRCAVTTERSVPVLEAAHIRPYTSGGQHLISNGLLLRADLHRLYDRGFVTVTPDYRFRVGKRLADDWKNGRVYYELDGRDIQRPAAPEDWPDRKFLEWHADERFVG